MARKTLATRQKQVFRLDAPVPRNPLVVPASQRVAGRHGATEAARRRAAKQQLQAELKMVLDLTSQAKPKP